MKELRELYDKTSEMWEYMKISVECLSYAESKEAYYDTIVPVKENAKDLIESMHNALPELLDAWETLEALRWANDLRMNGTCDLCPFYDDDVNVWKRGCDRQCRALFEFEGEWLSAYREAQKNEGVE